jgi:photosystem II stability/assembly factor-like uncharacterized protein
MAENLGTGTSYVFANDGYNYDEVIFQKGKPPLDSDLNAVQDIQNIIRQRGFANYPSGWLTLYPVYTSLDSTRANQFYTQDPAALKPEYALVNGYPIHFSKTNSEIENENIIDVGNPPSLASSGEVKGVFLETWKVELNPSATILNPDSNKPDPTVVFDSFHNIFMDSSRTGWICGAGGVLLNFNGVEWSAQNSQTTYDLNSIYFVRGTISAYTGTGWIAGNNGFVAYTQSGGNNWIISNTEISENLLSISSFDTFNVWAVGEGGTIIQSTNSGINFIVKSSGTIVNLNNIFLLNDGKTGWIVGDNGTLLKTTDAGTSWLSITTGTTQNLKSVYFYNGLIGFAVGDSGAVLYSSDGGGHWTLNSPTTENLTNIVIVPTLDSSSNWEEVTSQFLSGSNTIITTEHSPITKGDGNGTPTYLPQDLPYLGGVVVDGTYSGVTVDGTCVAVDGVDGPNGKITLHTAPVSGKTVKVNYYYRDDDDVSFNTWVIGEKGTVYFSPNQGITWTQQALLEGIDSTVGYNFNGVSFSTPQIGWLCGENSIIGTTVNTGSDWTVQSSGLPSASIQRVFYEGNTGALAWPNEDTIHPAANKETARRVQVQYRVRVLDSVDPGNSPEAGLSSAVLGRGPNQNPSDGLFPYANMGTINGDYGIWRAECPNTVDGYCYAVPMFLVNRRNSAPYNASTNPSGSTSMDNPSSIRPDLLTAANIADQDILDVRRKIIVPDLEEILFKTFNQMSSNTLQTNFVAENGVYGTQLLQVDGIASDVGTQIDSTTADVVAGLISSEMNVVSIPNATAPAVSPSSITLTTPTGYFHPNPAFHSAKYVGSAVAGHAIPGNFTGLGTSTLTFQTNTNALDSTQGITFYNITGLALQPNNKALTKIPAEPLWSKNYNSSEALYYQGVFSDTPSRIIESWDDPTVPGYTNYAVAFSGQAITDRASPVEVHSFIIPTTGGNLVINNGPSVTGPADSSTAQYGIYTIKKITSVVSGVTHRIKDIAVFDSSTIVTPIPEYEFIPGTVLEVVSETQGNKQPNNSLNFRNGAVITITPEMRKVENFTKSILAHGTTDSNGIATLSSSGNVIIGCSTTDMTAISQTFCWVTGYTSSIIPVNVTGLGTDTLTISTGLSTGFAITMQLLIKENSLAYPSLIINYNYAPSQCQTLPASLTVKPVLVPPSMFVSNLGPTGGSAGEPYTTPLEQIPINGTMTETDFCNKIYLQFANMLVSSGFAQMPTIIPGNFEGEALTFSGPLADSAARAFYTQCSQDIVFEAEGLQTAVPRKVYIPLIVKVKTANSIFIPGEYLMIVLSRAIQIPENKTGIFSNGNCAVSVYRIVNRPLQK